MAPRIILISLDGATDNIVDRYLQSGVLDSKTGLGLLKSTGVTATDNETVTPSLTAPSHIAIATGSTAVNNDINSNNFHLIANPFSTNTSGFAAPIGGYSYQSGIDPTESTSPTANPLWLSLQNAGKQVVAATFPGADGATIKSSAGNVLDKKEDRTVSYTVPFGEFGGQGAKGISLTTTDFAAAGQKTIDQLTEIGQTSFSPILQTKTAIDSFTIGGVKFDFQVAALDTSNDNKTNYDSIFVFDAAQGIKAASTILPSTGSAFLKAGDVNSQSFYLEGTPNKVGTGFFLSNLAADLSTVKIARYSANNIPRPTDSPDVVANADDINNNVGFWKPQPDFRIPERLSPSFNNFTDAELEAIYQDQVRSFADYQAKVAVRAIQQNNSADLVLTYIEQPDGSEHQFLLTDPRQASDYTNPDSIGTGQDEGKVARYQKYVEFAYQEANNAVQKIIDTVGVDPSGRPNSDVIVVSDHGFSPFHTAVSMNNLLKNAGFDSNKVRAVTSGPAVNIYINLKGREPNGTVEVAEYSTLQKQVLETLKGFTDTNPNYVTGASSETVFDKVYNREVPANATMANDIINARGNFIGEDTGDVFALLKTGYNFDGTQATPIIRKGDAASTSPILSVPNFYGAHGYDPTLPEMKAIYYAAGPDIGQQELGSVRNIDVAPTIEKILGVTPDATVNGTAISQNLPAFSGIAAGDTTANSAILWTRTIDSLTNNGISTKLNVQVSPDANFTNVPFTFETSTDAARDYTTKVDATCLESGTQYYYRFQSPTGQTSATGTFKTALDPTVSGPVRFAFSGDADGQWRPYSSTANFNKLGLDYFVFLGDTIYETGSKGSPAAADPVVNPSQALADYRRKYLENIQPTTEGGFQGLETLYSSQANYTLLDNHELGNKQLINGGAPSSLASVAGNGSSNPTDDANKTGTFINKTAAFKTLEQAYSEYQPVREKIISAPSDPRTDGTQQLYYAQQWGKNSIFVNVDDRTYRDVRLKTASGADDTGVRADNPDRTILGKTQLAWLKQTLLDSQNNGTPWKFVATSSPIDQVGAIGSGDDGGKSWIGGYRAERNELLKFVADNGIKNVVFLSTDDHQNRVNELTYLDNVNDPKSLKILPNAFSVVDGPLGAGGPDTITDHSFSNLKTLADTLVKKETEAGVNPIGLDPNFPGLKNVVREGDPAANNLRQPIDFFSPDTFNYSIFDVSADGKTLNVDVQGINSYAKDTFPEPSAANSVRSILSFSVDAAPTCPSEPDIACCDTTKTLVTTGITDGNDNLVALNGTDFDGRSNIVFTRAGNDSVDLSFATGCAVGNNCIDLGSGDDTVFVSQGDRVFGGAGDDVFEATDGKGNNRMSGDADNDTFYLGSGDQALGGDGNDRFFVGNGGDNLLTGGAGVDQFWLVNAELPATPNTILDFQVGTDVIGIQGSASLGINATSLILSQVGDDTSISFGSQTIALLKEVQASSLTPNNASQFVFA